MYKNIFNWMLMAALVFGLGITITSCSDDEDDNKKGNELIEDQKDNASIFWNVVGQLAGVSQYDADYKNKTYAPTIGEASESNPLVRIVYTNDLETAAMRFAYLVGDDKINATTASYTYQNDAVGTLIYTKTNDGSSLATVDVDIKQMPDLQQIVYMTAEQAGTNASFSGTAYYSFGDVITRTYNDANDGSKEKTEYWVCVRPPFGPEKKGDSHWVTFSPLPKKHIWEYTASTGTEYALPTGIGTNKEHMQNMAEMLYAILYPDTWYKNVTDNSKLKLFHDFNHNSVKYINQWFWKLVSYGWGDNNVFRRLFGEHNTSDIMEEYLTKDAFYMLYDGYSWWTSLSWNLSLYQAKYTINTSDATKKNLHDVKYETVKKNAKEYPELNVKTKYTDYSPFLQSKFFSDMLTPRFIVRVALGEELAGGQPNVYTSMASNTNGIKDYYVFTKFFDINVGNLSNMKDDMDKAFYDSKIKAQAKALDSPKKGAILGNNSKFYGSWSDCTMDGATPVGLVLFYDQTGVANKIEHGYAYKGLVMALEDADDSAWSKDANSYGLCNWADPDNYTPVTDLFGSINTEKMATKACDGSHEHPAAVACGNFAERKGMKSAEMNAIGLSQWFLPSVGQWILALGTMGIPWNSDTGTFTEQRWYKIQDGIATLHGNQSLNSYAPNGVYWTSTETTRTHAFSINLVREPADISFNTSDEDEKNRKTATHKVRPFMAILQ